LLIARAAGFAEVRDAIARADSTWFLVCFVAQVVALTGYAAVAREAFRWDGGRTWLRSERSLLASIGATVFAAEEPERSLDVLVFPARALRREGALSACWASTRHVARVRFRWPPSRRQWVGEVRLAHPSPPSRSCCVSRDVRHAAGAAWNDRHSRVARSSGGRPYAIAAAAVRPWFLLSG
jgi:hypothetical protein